MESLFLLIPVALVFCAIAIKLLLWAIDSGQYDDLDKESWRILNDDDTDMSSRRAAGADRAADRPVGVESEQACKEHAEKSRPGDSA